MHLQRPTDHKVIGPTGAATGQLRQWNTQTRPKLPNHLRQCNVFFAVRFRVHGEALGLCGETKGNQTTVKATNWRSFSSKKDNTYSLIKQSHIKLCLFNPPIIPLSLSFVHFSYLPPLRYCLLVFYMSCLMSHKNSTLLQHLSALPAIHLLISISAAFIYSSFHHSFSSPCLLFLLGYECFFGEEGVFWLLQHMWVDHKYIFTSHTPTHTKLPAWCKIEHNNVSKAHLSIKMFSQKEAQVAGSGVITLATAPTHKGNTGRLILLTPRWGLYLWRLLGYLSVNDTIWKMPSCSLRM